MVAVAELEPTAAELSEFDVRLAEARKWEAVAPAEKFIDGNRVAWAPQPGAQELFLECPLFECLIHGTRGGGKSDVLIMDFAQHVGRGYGADWRGILFRQTYAQLADIVAKTEKWFRQIFPGARFNRSKMVWVFETGEQLLLRYMKDPEDYWNYHGHEYPWIGWEELTTWADDQCFRRMFSCVRSSNPNVPRKVRATTNPWGKGHNWVALRYRLKGRWYRPVLTADSVDYEGQREPPRLAIYSTMHENRALMDADPDYVTNIRASASNQAMQLAWEHGSWDVTAGGMFDDVWDPAVNCVSPFAIPRTWYLDRSFDWGSTVPFWVGWWAESDGSDVLLPNGQVRATVRGDLFLIKEWYGWTGRPNEGKKMLASDVAKGIVERELAWGIHGLVNPGPADSAIYTVEDGHSIAASMEDPIRIESELYPGVAWTRADKSPGSRVVGWEVMRDMVQSARYTKSGPRERPGLFVFEDNVEQFLRTVPSLPRSEKDPDDVDTDVEDHAGDASRYRCRAGGVRSSSGTTTGLS